MITAQLTTKVQKGFTLIELLVVIAILSVLAAAVIMAINPVEQIARSRDAGRVSSVSQLGTAMQAYFTNQSTGQYPVASNNWQSAYLVADHDLQAPINLSTGSAPDCAGANTQDHVCYNPLTVNTTNDDAVIWTVAESQNAYTKAGCTAATPIPVYAWEGQQGKTGLMCLATATTVISTGGLTLK